MQLAAGSTPSSTVPRGLPHEIRAEGQPVVSALNPANDSEQTQNQTTPPGTEGDWNASLS